MKPLEELHKVAEPEIRKVVAWFKSQHGGDFDELLQEAELIFVDYYRHCTSELFEERYKQVIRWRLLDNAKKIAKEHARRSGADLLTIPEPRHFDLPRFIEDLSEDAAEVATLVINPPQDVIHAARLKRGEHDTRSLRGAVYDFLYDIGWAASRIAESIKEIREALKIG